MTSIINANGTSLIPTSTAANGGYVPLGTLGAKSVVLSQLTKTVFKLSPAEMKEMELKTLCGADWCEENYARLHPKKEVVFFDYRALATDIIRDCQRKGPYVESYERKTGVWLMKDGQLVINGSELWRPDGTVLEHGIHEDRIYSANGDVGFNVNTPEATDEEVDLIRRAFSGIEWQQPLAPELQLGWLGVAFVAPALRRRSHLFLGGRHGVGKSTALEQMKWLLGSQAFACTGPQTMMAYAQSVGGSGRAVVLDEFEVDPTRRYGKDTLEVARHSYSLQEGDEGIVRGTPSGVAKSYRFYSPFIAAGICPGEFEARDLSRWVMLEAKSRKADAFRLTEDEGRRLGPRLARRFVSRWSVFQASEKVVCERILAAGGNSRLAETVGTLLAAYWAFVSSQPATVEDADVLVEMLDIQSRIEASAEADEHRCLEALLTRTLPFKFMEEEALVTRNLSISEAIQRVCDDPTGNPEIVAQQARIGLRVAMVKGVWKVFIANSPEHQGLRRVYMGTKWATGGWSMVLRRLPGGEESTQRLGAGFPASKVTVFDVPAELLPAQNDFEFEQLLAA